MNDRMHMALIKHSASLLGIYLSRNSILENMYGMLEVKPKFMNKEKGK